MSPLLGTSAHDRKFVDDAIAEHERNPDDVISREQVLAEARRR